MEGSGGVFEIQVDGNLKFSKKARGCFPSRVDLERVVSS
ncbi:MAG TPA: hypothetical protein DGR97_08295 [Gammaproteobacteria bacterium]|nr:hypothetical protein [Gammaproteobacteria bacterium]